MVRLTTLAENSTSKTGLLAEHGLSILIEANGLRVLFDTGQTHTAVHNARALGVDLRELDAIVLSHGHYDHTGGLKSVLQEVGKRGRPILVAAHPEVWSSHYSRREGERPRYIGIPFLREEMESLGADFRLSTKPIEIGDGITTTGEVPFRTAFERIDSNLVVRAGDGWAQDTLSDDLALIVKTKSGLVVVAGCAHRGIVNTLLHARQITGEDKVLAVVGGTHLGPAPEAQLERTIAALKEMGVRRVGVSHCTGLKAGARLAYELGPAFFFNTAGAVVELDGN